MAARRRVPKTKKAKRRWNSVLRWTALASLGLLLLTSFNNCGNYAEPMTWDIPSLTCDDDCITPKLENLSIKVNLGGGTEYSVPANLAEFNLGGDCNEGGYPHNTIRWELYLQGTKVRDSGMLGLGGPNLPAHSKCVNGRFLLYISLLPINEDNVNRTGLGTGLPGNRAAYDLYVEIFGQEQPNGPAQRNLQKGRTRISLLAI